MSSAAIETSRPQTTPTELTSQQIDTLRRLLAEGLADQQRQLEHHESVVSSLGAGGDDGGREREMARVAADRARETIADIVDALARVDDGRYGTCEACGRAIPFERLEAIPQARRCVSCRSSGPGR